MPVEEVGSLLTTGESRNERRGGDESRAEDVDPGADNEDKEHMEDKKANERDKATLPHIEYSVGGPVDITAADTHPILEQLKNSMKQGPSKGIPFISQQSYRIDPMRQELTMRAMTAQGVPDISKVLGPLGINTLRSELEKQASVGSVWTAYLEDATDIGDYERMRMNLDQENGEGYHVMIDDHC